VTTALVRPDLGPALAQGLTLRDLVPQFLQWFKFDLDAFLTFCDLGGLVYPADVKVKHVELFMGWLRQAPRRTRGPGVHSVGTVNRHLAALRAFFGYLNREEILAVNVAAHAFMLRKGQKLPSYLTIDEQEALLDTMILDRSPLGQRDLAIVGLMLFAGLRASEVVHLRLEHVDLKSGRLRVIQGKGNKDRELPITPRLAGFLAAYLSDGRARLLAGASRSHHGRALPRLMRRDPGWFFVAQVRSPRAQQRAAAGQPLLRHSLHRMIHLKVSALVGRPVHPHALRHSFASRLRENGADLQLIQEALGHEHIATTTIYAHLTTKKRREDVARYLEGTA
jgi:site-specific recombinase XerD